jgi:dihydroorotase
MCISTKRSVRQIAHAKADGLRVTCEVTPHQLALTDECLRLFDANYKVDPPLRTEDHIEALIAGLKDGTIDAICSDHQPYAEEKKAVELDAAPFGIIGLETLLPICIKTLIEPGRLTWPELIAKLTTGPARILGINKGTLKLGADGDVTIIDPNTEWTIDAARFQSQSRNTPFDGWKVKGRAHTVIVRGQIRYQAD